MDMAQLGLTLVHFGLDYSRDMYQLVHDGQACIEHFTFNSGEDGFILPHVYGRDPMWVGM